MKKYHGRIVLAAIIVVAIAFASYSMITNYYSNSARADHIEDAYMKFVNFDPNAPLGSEENPFIILEIVPYRGMGQIGYLIGGQEPVSPRASTPNQSLYDKFQSIAPDAFEPVQVKKDKLEEEDKKYLWAWEWIKEEAIGQSGYFQKVEEGTGLYNLIEYDGSYSFTKDPEGDANYVWVEAENTNNTPTDYEADQVWLTDYTLDTSYWINRNDNQWLFRNKEIFKRNILHIPEEQLQDYQIRVVTITPDVLNDNVEKFTKYYNLATGINGKLKTASNENNEIDLIGNADLIFISREVPDMIKKENSITFWEKYGRDLSGKATSPSGYQKDFDQNDLSWQATMELFMKVGVIEDSAPLFYNSSLIENPPGKSQKFKMPLANGNVLGYLNNVYKLCLLLRQRDPLETYNLYFNTNEGDLPSQVVSVIQEGNATGKYLSITPELAKYYWNEYTFLPPYPDGTYPHNDNVNYPTYREYLVDGKIIFDLDEKPDAVIRNTYSFRGSNMLQNFSKVNSGLQEVRNKNEKKQDYNIEFFDYLEKKAKENNPDAKRPNKASHQDAIDYLLNKEKPARNRKKEVKILDLEPSNDFTLTIEKIRQMIPSYPGKITIVQQTTAEFIGKIEDLNNTYDMIFIGTKTGKMKTDSMGRPIYNDPLMDKLIYSHVGDRMIAFDTFSGILRDSRNRVVKAIDRINFKDYDLNYNESNIFKGDFWFWIQFFILGVNHSADFYRFSGNDISSIKKSDLEEFIDAGFPILLEKELYERNTDIIDDSSYLYQFLNHMELEKYKDNFINFAELTEYTDQYYNTQRELAERLSNERLEVELTKWPVEFDVDNEATLITDRKLPFEFSILPPATAKDTDRYEWRIYVDANADGRYEENEVIASDTARAGVQIRLTKRLSEEYTGVIPWKLQVLSIKNSNIRTEKIGYSAFKVQMNELEKLKTQLNVLQITSNNKSTINLEKLLNPPAGKTSLFYKYTHELDDFNIDIKTVTVDEFLSWYKGPGKAYDPSNPEVTDKLSAYDMLIFGFGDYYSDISNENGALNNVQAFIDNGKSVMFTHDTTSFINLDRNEMNYWNKDLPYWGYGINQYLRNRLGMDRFGVKKEAGDTTTYDRATMPSKARNRNIYGSSVDTYPETQGLTYGTLVAFGNPVSKSKGSIIGIFEDLFGQIRHDANKKYPPFAYGNPYVFDSSKGGNDKPLNNYMTNYVSKVNDGQLTNYPYKIPDWFEVAPTHMQYYQLNMDDPEIVVWYTLSDDKSNHNPSNSAYRYQLDHANETGPYSVSPNDVRNNYYIYSKGNVMYTGVGHTAIDALVDKVPENSNLHYEVKLFINTMIASYNAGMTAPKVRITNDDVIENSEKEYLLYEDTDVADVSGDKKRIQFIAEDMNLLSENLILRIYSFDSEGQLVLENPKVKSDYTTVGDYKEEGKEPGYIVKSGREYYFDLDLGRFNRNGRDQIYITATNMENLKGSTNLIILGRSLFDLD